ncbi:T9SS type B sorting domain-containing protein [Flavobacterium sp. RHBU_24]|uniref:T9SS type B sorting domain-containing protein n=1 Tax=Flavobacterium sp. RHBU_24 TaxID=3391185 RepID=UPI003984EB2C
MRNKSPLSFTALKFLLLVLAAIGLPLRALSQIYKHDFGNTTITTHPYTVAPPVLNANLSGSSWINSAGAWSSNTGATGQAIQMTTPAGSSGITLTFNVAAGFAADITSFDFWTRRSNSGPQNWQLAINGTTVGSGLTSGSGTALGTTPVSTPITGLTGTVTVTLSLSNANGGNIRLDDFTLNGSVYSNCNTVSVTSFSPASGPENTQVTIIGSGFTNAATVKFDGITTPFTAVSNTEIKAIVPPGITSGIPSVQATDGCQSIADSGFTTFESQCGSGEIYISELYDQTPGSGGMIELYNPSNNTVTFNAEYVMNRYGDVGGPLSYTLTLPGSIAAHSTYLVNCGPPDQSQCVTPISSVTLGAGFNGDDRIDLLKNNVVIDRVDVPYSAAGFTLIRNLNAVAPVPVYNINDWNNNSNPDCSNLGIHPAISPVPAVTQPQPQTVCEGGTATFTTAVATGTGYTYQWKVLVNGGSTWNNVTNNANYSGATTATLSVANIPATFNGNQYYCVITSTTCDIVTNAALLTVGGVLAAPQAIVTDATCAALGQAIVTSPLGAGITYNINGGTYQSSVTFPNLTAGNYSIIAKNAAGCTSAPLNFTIQPGAGAPAAPVFGTPTQPTCATPTGSITITSPTGTGITYSTDGTNYQAGTTFTLTPGTYSVTAKNAAGCVSPATSVTINPAPSAPTAPVVGTPTQPTCATPTGSITITSPTGTGITYSTDGTNYQSGTTFTLTPGTYSVTAKNAAGCVSPATSVTINPAPSAPTAPVVGTPTQPTCATPTGSITITAPTGTGITYSTDGTNYQAGTTFTLTPGTYSVTAKNAAGCVSPATSVTINPAPSAPTAPVVGTPTQPTCATPTGSITITAPTGTGITYSTDGTNYQAGTTFTLTPGTYSVTAKNAAGCVSPATSVTINPAPSAPTAPVFGTPTQPTCATPTGSITITSPTGTGITYSTDGTNYQAGTTFTLTPGTYSVTAKNAAGCVSPATSVTINPAPSAPTAPLIGTTTQPTCATPTGSITITAPTGTGITYSTNGTNYQAGTTFTLTPGTYSVTAKNAAGCVSPATSVTINPAPAAPAIATVVPTQPDCNTPTGSLTITAPTGTGYQYSLNGGTYQTATAFTGLPAGSYSITTKNADGCTSVAGPFFINASAPTFLPPDLDIEQPDCDTALGTITVLSPTGAGLSYSIDGSNYQAGTVFTGLTPGTYSVTTKYSTGCISLATVQLIVSQPSTPPAPDASVTQQPDCSLPTGTITVTPAGTGFMYSVNGSNYQTSNVFSGLAAGSYNITVRNSSGCVSPAIVRVINAAPTGPTAPSVIAESPADCSSSTGSLTILSPTGNGLTYSIDGVNYQAGTLFTGLPAGSYPVTVKNTAGCVSVANIKVIDGSNGAPAEPTLSGIQPDCTHPLGSITVTSPTGTGLSYSIDGGLTYQTGVTFASLEPGTYSILVKNTAGCVSTPKTEVISAFAGAPTKPVVTPTQPDCTTATGSFIINSPVAGDITYSINGAPYQAATTYTTLAPGTYQVIAKNGSGCISLTTTVVISPAPAQPAVPTVTPVQPTCSAPAGKITVINPVGPGYTYSIDGGTSYQTSPVFDGLGGGTYYITVKNAAGCTATSTFILIDAPPAPAPSPGVITGNGLVCMGDTISLTESVTGGIWSSSNDAIATVDATGVVTPVSTGTVQITYTVGTQCTASAPQHTVTVYNLPQLNLTNIWLCEDPATGLIIASKELNTGLSATDYTFVWSKGSTVLPDTSSTLDVDETGTYTVTVTNNISGCSNSATVNVGISSLAVADVVVGTDFTNSQTITVTVTGGSGDYEYSLSGMPYQDEPVFRGVSPGEYTVRVRDRHACGFIELSVFALNYPRFFTPNSDGTYDTWNIKDLAGQRDAVIFIFDRFGKIITSVYPSGRGWDGTLNGYPLPATDYWFTLLYTASSGDKKEFKAHFSLLR